MSFLKSAIVAMLAVASLGVAAQQSHQHGKQRVQRNAPKEPVIKPLEAASPDQLQAAERAYYGAYQCEFSQTVDVAAHPKSAGYIDVKFKNKVYTMKPVLSSTGALRLEDVTGRTLMIQIATKSMLMDVKAGQRLVDECVHPEQAGARPS